MGMSSLGVGSGLDLDGLVRQLLQVERAPRMERLDTRKETADVSLSGLSKFKSAMTKFNDSLASLSNAREMSARSAQIANNPEDNPFLNATANSSAARGNYNIQVEQLAVGTRAQSGVFGSSAEEVSANGGTLTFNAGAGNTFDVEIAAGATLEDVAKSVNRAAENFGVSASIVNTGGATPETYLVFDSSQTGTANELSISNNNAELDAVSTVATGATAGVTVTRSAADARIDIDGIKAFSETNTFTDAIQNVELDVQRATEGETLRLTVDVDKEGVRGNIDEFISSYNSMIDEIDKLTKYNEDGKNGPLIGDSLVRSARSRLASVMPRPVAGADEALNSLFKLGITTNNDGKLEFDSRDLGGGTGEQRFDRAIADNFDSLTALFAGENGLATKMKATVDEYTRAGGLIDGRERVFEGQKERVATEREQFERYMENYERTLRQRYASLDKTIAGLQQSSDFLMQRLNQG
ncbi:flagellar filament capping protein FliD [Aliidiomarina sp. Khilg15.8]